VPDISAQLRLLLEDEGRRGELSRRARERALEFSWESFAQVVLGTLESAALQGSGDGEGGVAGAAPHRAARLNPGRRVV
jgi:hypothetical protein